MARVEKNAAGEDVRVDTAEYGCIVIDDAASETATKTKAKAAKSAPEAADEGEI